MTILGAYLSFGLNAFRPKDYEGIGSAATVGFAFPAPEWRVAGVRPTPGVVIEVFRAAKVVYRREVLLQVIGHIVEELALVHRAVRAAFGARAIVRNHHDQGVVVLTHVL